MKPFVKFGLIGAGVMIIWTLIGYIIGNENMEALKWPGFFVMIGVMIYTMRGSILEKKNSMGGFISFGQGFGMAALTALITWSISSAFTYLYFKFINPEQVDFIKDQAIEQYEGQGMSEEQIEQAVSMMGLWVSPGGMAIWGFLGMMFFSLIVALVIAAVLKKESPGGMLDSMT